MLRSALVAVALVATACGGTTAADDTAVIDETTNSSITAAPNTTVPLVVTGNACAAYLDFLGAQDGVELNAALADLFQTVDDSDLGAAILIMRDGTGPLTEVRAAADLLSGRLVPACENTYSSEVSPAATDQEAAQLLVDSLAVGDRDAARTVAWANVIAQFEPWDSLLESDGAPSFQIEADLLTFDIGEGIAIDCLLGQGQIILCEFE